MKGIIVAGIIILVSISPLFRGLYFSYEAYGFMAVLALLFILYFFDKLRSDAPIKISKPFTVIGIALIAATAISFINAVNPRENLGALLLHSELLVMFIVLYDYFYERKQQFIRYLIMSVVVTGSVCAVVGLMALTGRFNIWEVTTFGNRIGSTFQYANTAAIYFVICLIFVVTLVNIERNVLIRAIASGLGSIFIYAFLLTGSRGGYLVFMLIIPLLLLLLPSMKWINSVLCLLSMTVPVFITLESFNSATSQQNNLKAALSIMSSVIIASMIYLALFLIYRSVTKDKEIRMLKGTRIFLGIALSAVLVFAVVYRKEIMQLFPEVMSKRLNRLITEGFYDKNIIVRLYYDIDALKLIADNWLVGLGGGGWKAMYQSVQDYSYIAAFVHNHYFQVFVENGILGFISFISMVVVSIVGCIHTYRRINDTIMRTYTAGLLCALISLAGHSAGDFNLSFISLMLLLWAMFAAAMPSDKWSSAIKGVTGKLAVIVVSSVLFSFFGIYFLGAYNENIGFKYNQKRDYKMAVVYYEEALRFDPANSFYSFELAKLYHYFGRISSDSEAREKWFEKARQESERSVEGNKNYPAYMNTLVKIYIDSEMPLEALEMSRKLVDSQKYNSEAYELLAGSLIEAARYYEGIGDIKTVRELLAECIDIDQNPYLRKSVITDPRDIGSEKKLSKYRHSDILASYLKEAADRFEELG